MTMAIISSFERSLWSQVEWTVSGSNPVLQVGDPGTWDSTRVFANSMLKEDGEYKLWYMGSPTNPYDFELDWQVGCASSENLDDPWQKINANPCFPFQGGRWDVGVFGLSVLHDSATNSYKMWYGGARGNRKVSIGYATSKDGLSWDRYSDHPVMESENSWEFGAITEPSVVFDGEKYWMWYTGRINTQDSSTWRIGLAASTDGINWTKHPGNPVLRPGGSENSISVLKPQVLFDGSTSTFEMWYTIRRGDIREIGYATSLDGVTWVKYPGNPLVFVFGGSTTLSGPVIREGSTYHMNYNPLTVAEQGTVTHATAPWTLPKASFTISPVTGDAPFFDITGVAPFDITVDAARSVSPAGDIVNYRWDFGDGETAEGIQVPHTYTRPGNFLLKLTVTDSATRTGSVARLVLVTKPPHRQIPGDCNQDKNVDITDAVCILGTLFLGQPARFPCGDGTPAHAANRSLFDWQPDDAVDISDAVSLLRFLFLGGPRHPLAIPGMETAGCVFIADCPSLCP
ncbi:MAG: PKD domain-containing protein [Planctomycetes bacterium]|nr:PKD domain-containing protein [Planctomycetota bacterium]